MANRDRVSLALLMCAVGSLAVGSCSKSPEESLAAAGWTPEPYLVGAEPSIGRIAPAKCRDFYTLLERSNSPEDVSTRGYQHESGSYLLIKDWGHAKAGYGHNLTTAGLVCSRMSLDYGPAKVDWEIAQADALVNGGGSGLRIRVTDDANELLADMLIASESRDGRTYLVRVMNTHGDIGDVERIGMGIALREGPNLD